MCRDCLELCPSTKLGPEAVTRNSYYYRARGAGHSNPRTRRHRPLIRCGPGVPSPQFPNIGR
eukprot:4798508-Prymnesium_polylepis.1